MRGKFYVNSRAKHDNDGGISRNAAACAFYACRINYGARISRRTEAATRHGEVGFLRPAARAIRWSTAR